MYKTRLKIFIFMCICSLLVCIGRLAYLQLKLGGDYRRQIEEMRILGPMQLPTIRGSILDRNGRALAVDKPAFYLYVNYEATRLLDDRFWRGVILQRKKPGQTDEQAEAQVRRELQERLDMLLEIIYRSAEISNIDWGQVESKIRRINDRIWNMRRFFAWLKKFPDSPVRVKYKELGQAVPIAEAQKDFQKQMPDADERLRLIMNVNLKVMHQPQQLMELKTEDDLLRAQLEFVDTEMVEIFAHPKRVYPYNSAAAQVIGWVGTARAEDKKLFAHDKFRRYLDDELSGKGGVEKISEVVLRGKRGEVVYDRDSELVSRSQTQFGKDVTLSLDIELQGQIEKLLTEPNSNPNYNSAIGAVVIDVATSDILALVSVPVYNLNDMRVDYTKVRDAAGAPLVNKAVYKIYPPGSVIKPLVLAAGIEEGKVGAREVISCPYERAPRGWPNCLQYREFKSCHDWKWTDEGGNIARNAIRGSCNIYFSRLADRLAPAVLQKWLYDFGFGRDILPGPVFAEDEDTTGPSVPVKRNLSQSAGQISSDIPRKSPQTLSEIPKIAKYERRMFGIGQGNLRVTVLQVANAMAVLARGGIYKSPRLFLTESDSFPGDRKDLNISRRTLETVRDGMSSVVNEWGGTAYSAFDQAKLRKLDLNVHGKTGSTEGVANAWFAGFAEDKAGRVLSIAVTVEGGESGAEDATPLARDIILLCNKAGYIGKKAATENVSPDAASFVTVSP
ncbi:MAG: peptidoglycan D,D-transpeptidase FtsI family protein [Planctomycetota bacterium]|jgi:penicillin-binding protein 2